MMRDDDGDDDPTSETIEIVESIINELNSTIIDTFLHYLYSSSWSSILVEGVDIVVDEDRNRVSLTNQ